MDSTSNANQPGRSRRLLSRFSLTLTVILIFSFLAMSTIGPATQDAEALSWSDVAVVGASASAGAALGAVVGDGIGAVLGAAGGAIIGALLIGLNGDSGDAAINSGAKATYASALKNITEDYLGLASAEITNLNTLWNTSQYYLARKAEYAALQLYQEQTAAGASYTYDPYYVLSESEVSNATNSYVWAMNEQLSAVLNAYTDLATSFVGTYEGMSWGLLGTSGSVNSYASSTSESKTYRCTEFMTMGRTPGTTYLAVSADSDIYLVNTGSAITSTVTITNRNGTVAVSESVTLGAMESKTYNLADLGFKSGDYCFSCSNSAIGDDQLRWFGQFSNSISSSGTVYSSLLSMYKDGDNATIDFLAVSTGNLPGDYSGAARVFTSASNWYTGYQPIFVVFDTDSAANPGGVYSDPGSYQIALADYLELTRTMLDKTALMQSTANSFAHTYYNYLVTYGDEAILMPDVIFPDPSQLEGMSWEQIYAIYIAYMTQMEDWFYENNGQFDGDNVTLSAESLNLTCRGAIYDANGTMLYDNGTVWTPYVSLDDMTLYAGQNNTMTQPGFIIVWATGVSSLESWDRTLTCVYLPVKAGYNLSIEEMMYQGELADEVTLTVTTVEFVIYEPGGDITPVQITTQTDAEWIAAHWYYLAIAAGVICLMAAMATRNQPVLIAGVVLLVAGAIGWYLAGDSSLLDWFSIVPGPDKFSVWLQGLR